MFGGDMMLNDVSAAALDHDLRIEWVLDGFGIYHGRQNCLLLAWCWLG